jgi:hypothetical protein
MKYQQKTFSVSMPGASCAWPFQPRELACRPGWAHRFWLDLALACAWMEVHEALHDVVSESIDEVVECLSR